MWFQNLQFSKTHFPNIPKVCIFCVLFLFFLFPFLFFLTVPQLPATILVGCTQCFSLLNAVLEKQRSFLRRITSHLYLPLFHSPSMVPLPVPTSGSGRLSQACRPVTSLLSPTPSGTWAGTPVAPGRPFVFEMSRHRWHWTVAIQKRSDPK